MEFEWDEKKNQINRTKHGVDFELASNVWRDPNYILYEDRASNDEERWVAMGYVNHVALLLVVHTYRSDDTERVRIISARKATPHERGRYRKAIDP